MAADCYKRWTLHILYPSRYKRLVRKKAVRENKIVFLEVREKKLTDSFLPVYHALKKSGKWEIRCLSLQQDLADRKTVRALSLRAIRDLADAKYIFMNDSSYLIGSLPLRPQTKVIQLWHACGAFKRFGYSLTGKKFGAKKKELDRFPLYRNISLVTVSSPEVRWAYADAFSLPLEKILPVGVARTDVFYRPSAIRRAQEKLPLPFQQRASGLCRDPEDAEDTGLAGFVQASSFCEEAPGTSSGAGGLCPGCVG